MAMLPVAWVVQNVIHEGSHLFIAAVRYGLKPKALVPVPHKHAGRWYFARCEFEPTAEPIPGVWVAPVQFALVWIVVLSVLSVVLVFTGNSAIIWIIPFALAAYIDIIFWLRGKRWGSKLCDGKRWKRDCEREPSDR